MKVVRSDRFLITYVENRELNVRSMQEYREYEIIYCMKVVRSDRFLITYVENRELNAVRKSTAVQKWSDRTVFLSLTSTSKFSNKCVQLWNLFVVVFKRLMESIKYFTHRKIEKIALQRDCVS